MKNALTYEEFQKLAMQNYCKGGDGYVECWGQSEFDEYVSEFGPITKTKAMKMFKQSAVIDHEYEEAAAYFSGEYYNNEKENDTMNTNTFTTISGTTFTANESGTYFYAIWTEDGKQIKKRIKKAEYEAAKREHELEVDAKMHENLEKLVAKTEESNTDEEIAAIIESMDADAEDDSISAEEFIEKVEKVEKQKTRKAKKAKNKNAALRVWVKDGKLVSDNEGDMLELTAKQVDFLQHLPDTCFWEEGLDSCIWVDCLCDDIKGQFKDKPMTVGAMISTICEKNLGTRGTDRRNGRKCTSFRLTELGKLVAAELGVR